MRRPNPGTIKTLVWLAAALGLFIDGYDLYISSITEPFIRVTFHPSALTLGFMQGCVPIGAVFGAMIVGYLADKCGRKSMLLLNLFFFVGVTLLSACAWNVTSLCLFRFLIGLGVGADYPICAAYIAEMTERIDSGPIMAGIMFVNCLASPIGILVAWLLFKIHPALDVWRLMFASGAIPAMIGLLFRAKLPESFTWQAQQRLLKQSGTKTSCVNSYQQLFSRRLIKVTLTLAFCWFLMDISYYGVGLFSTQILQAFNIDSDASLLSSASDLILNTLIVNSFVVVGAFASIYAIKRIPSIKLQKIGFLLAGVGLLILSCAHTGFAKVDMFLLFSGFILFNFFVNFGPGITTYLLPTRLYHTQIRSTGHGFASGMGKLGAFAGTMLLPVLQVTLGIYITVFLLALTLFFGMALSFLLDKPITAADEQLDTNYNELLPVE